MVVEFVFIEVWLENGAIWSYISERIPNVGDSIFLPLSVKEEKGLDDGRLIVNSREFMFFDQHASIPFKEYIVLYCSQKPTLTKEDLDLISNAIDRVLGRSSQCCALCSEQESAFLALSQKISGML